MRISLKKISQLKSDIWSCRCKNFSLKLTSSLVGRGPDPLDLPLTLILVSLAEFLSDGAFYFTREPAKKVYFLKGSDASFQWNYTVEDRAAEFQFIIWKAQNVTTRTFYPLINEKENFDVAVSSRIPLAYVGRVEKKGEATLVIKSVNFEDSTTYRCLLQAKDTRSNQSDVQLHVTGMTYICMNEYLLCKHNQK